jgi:hypothetical protein
MPATTLSGLQVRAPILTQMLDEEEDQDDPIIRKRSCGP